MKNIYLVLFLTIVFVFNTNAQLLEKNCYYGITFDVSENHNWGYGELVITDIEPNSPAEKAGIKIGDIIMEINGQATYLRDDATIAGWLFDNVYDPVVTFTIRNMNTYFKEYKLVRRCINVNSISEQQLSSIFSFYSLENTSSRIFTLPLKVTTNTNVNFTDYHTYDFYKEDTDNVPPIDTYITGLLEKELEAKGLVRDTENPEIIVQSYYSYVQNPKYTGSDAQSGSAKTFRYDINNKLVKYLPVADLAQQNVESKGQYLVEYGFSFYDKKYINPAQLTQIWDCSIKEYLTSRYALEEYVRIHTPLMLMQFPFTTSKVGSKYQVSFNQFNYTGLYYDANDLMTIRDIIPQSPAYNSGIRSGYVLKKLNGKKIEHTKESLSEGYKKFITETMPFRDQATQFTNSEGYSECMFWNKMYNNEIAKAFSNSAYVTSFSYLYDFEKYVSNSGAKEISVEMWDGIQSRLFIVKPEIHKSVTIKIID